MFAFVTTWLDFFGGRKQCIANHFSRSFVSCFPYFCIYRFQMKMNFITHYYYCIWIFSKQYVRRILVVVRFISYISCTLLNWRLVIVSLTMVMFSDALAVFVSWFPYYNRFAITYSSFRTKVHSKWNGKPYISYKSPCTFFNKPKIDIMYS